MDIVWAVAFVSIYLATFWSMLATIVSLEEENERLRTELGASERK